jgi:hypothetical protein
VAEVFISLGKGEVHSSILCGSTSFPLKARGLLVGNTPVATHTRDWPTLPGPAAPGPAAPQVDYLHEARSGRAR